MKEDSVSKKILVTLPDSIHAAMQEWAESQGRPLANLCAFLLERNLREAIERGEVPGVDLTPTTSSKDGK